MGDISRHRDIFLFSRESVPTPVLDGVRLTRSDLTYLELGNYLTDVSQFRDPVTYIFAKQRVWREKVIPKTKKRADPVQDKILAAALAAFVASQLAKEVTSGTLEDVIEGTGIGVGVLGALLSAVSADTLAGLAGADDWIDTLLGTPMARTPLASTPGAKAERDEKHYGYMGEFFRLVIEGASHFLFAQNIQKRSTGTWGSIEPIPDHRLSEVYAEFFTQYFPHEHTDQPPYVWDASKRPAKPMYRPSRRQANLRDGEVGVMNAVDVHYVAYLAEGLGGVEDEWRALKRDDKAGRERLLVQLGKLLHGVEDWFFHSNVVELLELRSFRPAQLEGESDEEFLQRFVAAVAKKRPEFVAVADDPEELVRLKRRLYRRLRYPAYDSGTKTQSAGRLSTSRKSTPSLRHAYPAFPSSQDTSHTLLHALENLEHKAAGKPGELPEWVTGVLQARGITLPGPLVGLAKPLVMAAMVHELREWVPLVLTLLSEDERRRLVANVAPEHWPLAAGAAKPQRTTEDTEADLQAKRHAKALEPHPTPDGRTENNYEELVRHLVDRGHLNVRGQQALVAAFAVDRKAEQLPTDGPGCGGFLIQFSVELQELLDSGDAATAELNKKSDSVFEQVSNNGAFNEHIGSHSLMSKDTTLSVPFFDDARVLAAVASSSVLTIVLQQVATPASDRRIAWDVVLHDLIRYPPATGGWERRALALFAPEGKIPSLADIPELTQLAAASMRPKPAAPAATKSRRQELEELYLRLETELSHYRYP